MLLNCIIQSKLYDLLGCDKCHQLVVCSDFLKSVQPIFLLFGCHQPYQFAFVGIRHCLLFLIGSEKWGWLIGSG